MKLHSDKLIFNWKPILKKITPDPSIAWDTLHPVVLQMHSMLAPTHIRNNLWTGHQLI